MAGRGGKRSTSFKPGQSGNPHGRPKVAGEVQEPARQHTGEAIKTLVLSGSHTQAFAERKIGRKVRNLIERNSVMLGSEQPALVPAKPRQASQKQVPSGPLVQLDPNPVPKIKQVGGGNDDRWNNRVANSLVGSLPGAHSTKGIDETANATLAGLVQISPNDPIEGMLATQMISAHESALSLRRRAWHPEQSFIVRAKFLELADKATRSLAMLVDALDRHRGKGQQTVVVKHVTVNAEQAVVADKVVTGGGGKEPG
jgi:hypothetical protein